MVKKQALAVLILLMAFAGTSFGLGLGDIKVNSNLNDPLDAEIKIIQLQGLTSGEILPTLASNDDFRRAGVERSFFLSNIQFRVKENEAGEVFITLTTKQVVREPFLNFLVEVNWPGGRLLKEYTILLDPPVFDTGLAVDALVVEGSDQATELVTTTVIETQPTTETVSVATPVEPRDDTLAPGEYRVQRDDTLWEIAMKVPARDGYSPQQVMLAIQDLNAEAFLNNNINRVKAGSVLQLPDASQIALRSFQEAIDEVRAQNSGAAPNLRAPTSANSEAQLSATDTTGSALEGAGEEKNPDGYLELSADSDSGISGAGETSTDAQALLGQLSIAEELNDQYARERDELAEKVSELEAQIEIMERLLDVQNSDMAQVQEAIEQSEQAQEDAAEPTNEATEQADSSEQAPTPANETPVQVAPVKATPPAPVKQDFMWYVNEYTSTISNWVMASVTNMAIVGGAVLLILLIPFYLRSKRSGGDQVLSEMTESSNSFDDVTDDISPDLDEDLLSDVEDEPFEEVEEEAEQIDAVMEAEMYMAYQKYDQAEEKLKEAFADHPGRADIGLKLMEVYAETGNASGFNDIESRISMTSAQQEEAEALRAKLPIDQLDSDDNDMLLPDSDENFDLDLGDSLVEGGDESDDLGFDLDLSEGNDEPLLTQGDETDDLSFDLNLEEDTAEPELPVEEPNSATEEISTDLDFSLDLGDLDVDLSEEEGESLDFSLEEDSESIESPASEESTDLDFSLDFSEEETSDDDSSADLNLEGDLGAPLELDTDLDLNDEESDAFDLDLGELEESTSEPEESHSVELSEDDTHSLEASDDEFALDLGEESAEAESDDSGFDIDFSEGEASSAESENDPLQQLADSLDSDADLDDDEFDFLSGSDEISTKLDLARAYIEMDDKDGARDILDEVVQEGNDEQKSQAEALIQQL